MRKLVFVINPISGSIDKSGFRKLVVKACEQQKIDYTFFETSGSNDREKLCEKIDGYMPSVVIACGGDGTVNLVAEAIGNKDIKLGIIPLGSANGMARELELPSSIDEALRVVIKGVTLRVDRLAVNEEKMCLHLCDIGLNAKLIRRFEKGTSRGKLGYARHFFETIFNNKAIKYQFEFEGISFKERAEMVVFANARKYGTGAIVNPLGRLNDGKFEVCIFKPYPWYAILRLTWLFFTGQLNYSPFVKIISTDRVLVTASKPEHLQIDGESMRKYKKFEVRVDKPLEVIISETSIKNFSLK